MRNILLLIILFIPNYLFSQNKYPSHIQEVVDRESFFIKKLEKDGIVAGFKSVMYKNCTLFTPEMQDGFKYFKEKGNYLKNAKLKLNPTFLDVSNDRSLAISTGEFEYTREMKDSTTFTSYGDYLSIWVKNKNNWEIIVHNGIIHPKPNYTSKFVYADPITFGMKRSSFDYVAAEQKKQSESVLKATDEMMNSMVSNKFLDITYNAYFDTNIKMYRHKQMPISGQINATNYILNKYSKVVYFNTITYVAPSRDLGYTIGNGILKPKEIKSNRTKNSQGAITESESVNYIRIWRKGNDGIWRIVIDMETPADLTQY